MKRDMGNEFNDILRMLPVEREIVRPDGSFTLTTSNDVIVNFGTREQNHIRYNCSCGCGYGCREDRLEAVGDTIRDVSACAVVITLLILVAISL